MRNSSIHDILLYRLLQTVTQAENTHPKYSSAASNLAVIIDNIFNSTTKIGSLKIPTKSFYVVNNLLQKLPFWIVAR